MTDDVKKEGDGAQGGGQAQGGDGKQVDGGGGILSGKQRQDGGDGGAGGDGSDGKQQQQSDWPEAWRDKFAEAIRPGDTKFRERLDRMGSPVDIGKSWLSIEQRLSSGELKAQVPYPEKGTDEQKQAWRKEHNVPDKPEAYDVKLSDGMVVGEADKPVIEQFAKAVHGKNWTQTQFNDAVQTYYQIQDAQNQQIKAMDDEFANAAEEALRAEWGAEYRGNTTAIDNFLGALPGDIGPLLANGRLADGRKIGADPRVIKWLRDIVFDLNPAASSLPAGVEASKGLETRLKEISEYRKNNRDAYYKDETVQAEERRLLEARDRMKSRAA